MSDTVPSSEAADTPGKEKAIVELYRQLNTKCGEILENSLANGRERALAAAHLCVHEFEMWHASLEPRLESYLVGSAGRELQYALLSVVQGHYGHAFKSLRLVLELGLQAVYLSSNAVAVREWLASKKDTNWNEIVNDENGVFSARFVGAFCADLLSHRKTYSSLATTLYRECSECVHGNVQKHIDLPKQLSFNEATLELWHRKLQNVVLVVQFVYYLRYFDELTEVQQTALEPILADRLGHVPEIRLRFGLVGGEK